MAEAHLAARFNRPGHEIVDHYTYVIASDGDMMEGAAVRGGSLAGHLELGKLIVLYDDNRISLAGTTSVTFTEDVGARFDAYGWHVQSGRRRQRPGRGRPGAPSRAAGRRPAVADRRADDHRLRRPHKQGTFDAHGSPLGPDEVRAAKADLGWPVEPAFLIPDEARAHFRSAVERGAARAEEEWRRRLAAYAAGLPGASARSWPAGSPASCPPAGTPICRVPRRPEGLATRKASESVLQALAAQLPELIGRLGGPRSVDVHLAQGAGDFEPPGAQSRRAGRGRRRLGLRRAQHPLRRARARHGRRRERPWRTTAASSRTARRSWSSPTTCARRSASPPLRASARVWVYTHDSIGARRGRSDPPAGRALPGAARHPGPALHPARRRQRDGVGLESGDREPPPAHGARPHAPERADARSLDLRVRRGARARRLRAERARRDVRRPDVILIATGSEVAARSSRAEPVLAAKGIQARLVSMPCWELFEEQTAEYRESVLPSSGDGAARRRGGALARLGAMGRSARRQVSLDRFGASAPGDVLMKEFGFTTDGLCGRRKRCSLGSRGPHETNVQ